MDASDRTYYQRAMHPKILAGYLFGLLGVVIFGATVPMTRLAVQVFDPWFVTFGRAAVAGLVAVPVLAITRQRLPTGRSGILFVISLTLVIGFPAFAGLALLTVPAAHGGVVLGILPVATAVAATIFVGERPTLLFWILTLIGAALVVTFSVRQGAEGLQGGDALLALAAASAAIGYAFSGRLSREMPGWGVICWALVIALPLTIPASAILWSNAYLAAPAAAWGAFLYLALFSMLLGFFAWNAGLALGGIAHVGQVQLLQVFVTLVLSAALVGETIQRVEILFAALVTIVVALTGRARKARPLAPV